MTSTLRYWTLWIFVSHLFAAPGIGGVLPFRDEFKDPHDDGIPVLWRLADDNVGAGGTRKVEDGSFLISGTDYTASWVDDTRDVTDVSLQASVQFIEPDGLWSFGARASAGHLYWGGVWSDGRLFVGHTKPDSGNTIRDEMFTSYMPTDEDLFMQMDVYDTPNGVELSLFAWGQGESKPDEPQVRFFDAADTMIARGTIGMFINEGLPGIVAVRYFEAVPEPSTLVLSVIGLFALIGLSRRSKRFPLD